MQPLPQRHGISNTLQIPFLNPPNPSRRPDPHIFTTEMRLPQLPTDVWFRISTNLDPSSLSSLSLVSSTFHKVATHESHFRRHLPRPHTAAIHPAQEYRRLRAISYPPRSYVSFKLPSSTRMVGLVQDSLLLLDCDNAVLIIFPSGINLSLKRYLGDLAFPDKLHDFVSSFVLLPDSHVALMNCHTQTKLMILHVTTGEVKTHTLPGNGAITDPKILDNNLIAAGNNAEWLMYQDTELKFVLFNWRTGNVERQVVTSSQSLKYVMGECHATNSMAVVGTLSEQTRAFTRDISVNGFDGIDFKFQEDIDMDVLMVLRSQDKKTHILLSKQGENLASRYRDTKFYALRNDEYDMKEWRGKLKLRKWPELKENGRFIQSRQDPCRLEFDMFSMFTFGFGGDESFWMELKDDCTLEETTVHSAVSTPWIRRTHTGGYVLAVGGDDSDFKLLEMQNLRDVPFSDKEITSVEHTNKRWIVDYLDYVCVVADHFILALSQLDFRLYVYHFDRFCRRDKGTYGCPGFDEVTFLERTAHLGIEKRESGSEVSMSESEDDTESEGDSVLGEFW